MGGRDTASDVASADFADQVRDALTHLYDPVHLQTHALADLLTARGLAPVGRDGASARGRRLRQEILDAIEALRPAGDSGVATRRHQALLLRYVEGLEVAAVTQHLAIGRTQYYAEHRGAVAALVSLLRERWSLGPLDRAAEPAPSERPVPAATSVPTPLTSFVGRERSIEAATALLTTARLVTLTGPPGSGKSRLALAVAEGLAGGGKFPDGVHFAALAGVLDPELLMPTIARVLGVADAVGRSPFESVVDYLRGRAPLLVLDNFEHLLSAARSVAELLTSCPRLRVLVTSRAALRLPGEQELPVPPLAMPDARLLPAVGQLAAYEAIELFVARASAVRASFVLAEANAAAVAQICERLDGLPLAIELAAARVRVLSAEQIAARLGEALGPNRQEAGGGGRFGLLTGGVDDVPHHQALRATMDWSHGLLAPDERTLLRRLAVFAGGFTLAAAEAVCADDTTTVTSVAHPPGRPTSVAPHHVLDLLERLIGHSLVAAEEHDGAVRYRLLETVREYGWERLREAAEDTVYRDRHLRWCLEGAEAVPFLELDAGFVGAEHDNLRAALRWSIERGDPQSGFRLFAAAFGFWYLRGHYVEGRGWFDELIGQPGANERTSARATALSTVGYLAYLRGDYVASRAHLEESRTIAEGLSDEAALATTLHLLGNLEFGLGNAAEALPRYQAAQALNRRLGRHRWAIANALLQAKVAESFGDFATERSLAADALTASRREDFQWGITSSLEYLGRAAEGLGDAESALALLEECLERRRARGEHQGTSQALASIARILLDRGDVAGAARQMGEALGLTRDVGLWRNLLQCLDVIAEIGASAEPLRALRLAAAVEAARLASGAVATQNHREPLNRWRSRARDHQDVAVAAASEAEGRAMTIDEAIGEAFAIVAARGEDARVSNAGQAG